MVCGLGHRTGLIPLDSLKGLPWPSGQWATFPRPRLLSVTSVVSGMCAGRLVKGSVSYIITCFLSGSEDREVPLHLIHNWGCASWETRVDSLCCGFSQLRHGSIKGVNWKNCLCPLVMLAWFLAKI